MQLPVSEEQQAGREEHHKRELGAWATARESHGSRGAPTPRLVRDPFPPLRTARSILCDGLFVTSCVLLSTSFCSEEEGRCVAEGVGQRLCAVTQYANCGIIRGLNLNLLRRFTNCALRYDGQFRSFAETRGQKVV